MIVMNSVILFEIPRFAFVSFMLRIACEQLKVIYVVVQNIMVNVMDYLRARKGTPQMSSHDKAMLHNISIAPRHADEVLRTSNISNIGRVLTLSAAIRYPAFPRWVIFAVQFALCSLFWCGRLGVKLGLSLAFHLFRSPFIKALIRAKMIFVLSFPCVRLEERFVAVVASSIVGARIHTPIIAQVS